MLFMDFSMKNSSIFSKVHFPDTVIYEGVTKGGVYTHNTIDSSYKFTCHVNIYISNDFIKRVLNETQLLHTAVHFALYHT